LVLGYSFFGDGQSNGVIQFYPGPSLVAMETNFETKWAITRLCKRHQRDFCIYRGVFGDGPANAVNRILPCLTLVAMGTKFGTKWAITGHNMYEISPRFLHLTKGFEGGANK